MITLKSNDYGYIIIKNLNLGPYKSGTIDENTLIFSELKSIESLYILKKLEISSEDISKIRTKIAGLEPSTGGSGPVEEAAIQTISVNGNNIPPDSNKNVNINISALGGGGINVIDYYPEDNVTITGPIPTVVNSNSVYEDNYLSISSSVSSVIVSEEYSIEYAGVKLNFALGGSIKLDMNDITDVSSYNSGLILFSEENKTLEDFYRSALSGTFPSDSCFLNFSKETDGSFSISSNWTHNLLGHGNDSAQLDTSVITLRKSTFIEYYLATSGLTLEELTVALGPEAMALYETISILSICKDETDIKDGLFVAPLNQILTNVSINLVGMLNTDNSETYVSLDPNNRLLVDSTKRVYTLPENISDGSYLNIKSDVILLNTSLKKDDYFLLYSNLTKGIRIPQPITNGTVTPTGKFRGYNIVQPEDAVDGDWYLKDVWVQATTSYVQMIYVYVGNYGWKMSGYLPSSEGTTLTYNSSTNRVISPSGYPVAGYLGVYYNGNTPTLGSSTDQSLIYDASYGYFRYSSGGQWWSLAKPVTGSDIISELSDSSYTSGIPSGEAIKTYVSNKDIDWNKIINKPWAGGIEPYPLDLLLTQECNFDSTANDWVVSGATKSLVTYTNEPAAKNRLLQDTQIHFPVTLSFKGSLDLLVSMASGDSFSFLLGVNSGGSDPIYLEISKTGSSFIINTKNASGNISQTATLNLPNIDGRRGFRLEYVGGLRVKMSIYWMNNNSEIVKQTIFENVGYQVNGRLTIKGISGYSEIHRITGRS